MKTTKNKKITDLPTYLMSTANFSPYLVSAFSSLKLVEISVLYSS